MGVIIIIACISGVTSKKEFFNYGISLGFGFYVALLSSGFIIIYSIYSNMTSKDETSLSKEQVVTMSKKWLM